MTSGLETEWDYSGRKGRDGQKKKIDKANKKRKKEKSKKRAKDEKVNTRPTTVNDTSMYLQA